MTTIYDVDGIKLVEIAAVELKKLEQFNMPEWAKFVKTSSAKDRHPMRNDWWYLRTASILRKIYIRGPIGVSKLRKEYASKKRRGHKRNRVCLSSGKIIRVILQQLEKAEFIKQEDKRGHKGRVVTSKGMKFLNGLCKNVK